MRKIVILTAIGTAIWAAPASAHAFLKTAVPGVGATVPKAPSKVRIDFTEGVEPTFSSIAVTDAAGKRVDTGILQQGGNDAELSMPLEALPPGTYRVSWHVTAIDTHKTEGSYSFTVAK